METKIIQWNCRGYRKNYPDIQSILQQYQPACVLLQETMLGQSKPSSPRNYALETFSPGVNAIPGTGLAILVRSDSGYRKLDLATQLQAIAVQMRIGDILLTVCNIYISPGEAIRHQDMADLESQLPRPHIMGGDFNGNHLMWGSRNTDQRGKVVETLLLNTDLGLLNSGEPTHFHVQTGTSSAIDLSLCSPDIFPDMRWTVDDDPHGSDHFPIVMEVTSAEPAPAPCHVRYILKRADWETFEALTDMEDIDNELPVDDMTETLTSRIITAASASIPQSKGGTVRHNVPWWTAECTIANVERRRALLRYQRSRSMADKISYKRARAIAQSVKKNAKRESWRKYVSTINKDTPMSVVWKRIRRMKGHKQQHSICLTSGGITTATPVRVAEILADHFADVSNGEHYPAQFMRNKHREEQRPLDFTTVNHEPYNEDLTMTEIFRALTLTSNTSPGPDGVHYKMMRRMHPSALATLLALFNKIWNTQTYPHQWSIATVLAFPKPGKPPTEASSYRPIALTSCIGKLMEKIVNVRLVRFLEANHHIAAEQFGFRRCRGTTDALIRLQNHVVQAKGRNEHTVCVLFDLHKAYDTTWRHGILKSIHRMGIRGNMAQYLRQFLSNRSFRVKVQSSYSEYKTQHEGVPQGSVISCTLFLLALNEITADLPNGVYASLYVDDLVLFASSRYLPALTRRMQDAINRVSQWATTHGFMFSIPKTKALHFRPGRNRDPSPLLTLHNEAIDFVMQARFLGMLLDHNLSWRPHIKQLKTDCMQRMNVLKSLSRLAWGGDRTTLLSLYRSLIRSKLDYGCIIYQSANQRVLATLDPVHNASIILCTGAFRTSPVVSLYAESGEPSLYTRRVQLTLQYLARLRQLPLSPTWVSVCAPHRGRGTFPYNLPSTNDYSAFITETELPPLKVLPTSFSDVATWRLPITAICLGCKYPKKQENSANLLKHLFLEHVHHYHSDSTHIYTDGSKTGDAVGCAAVSPERSINRKLMGETSIYSAELYALTLAMDIINDSPYNNFTIFSDSKSSIQALRAYDSNHPIISQITEQLLLLAQAGKSITLCWVPGHVDITGNDKADTEAKRASTSADRPVNTGVPARDLYPVIKLAVMTHWQRQWTEQQHNKLRELKDTIRPWSSSCCRSRRMETVLCRLRIGHTRLTHGYLMERSAAPYCEYCLVPLTVRHLIAECPSYDVMRHQRYPHLRGKNETDVFRGILAEVPRTKYNLRSLEMFLNQRNILDEL